MTREELENKGQTFLQEVFSKLSANAIDVSTYLLDHICWRVDSILEFDEMESTLLQFGKPFHRSVHNGRIISLIQLTKPITFQGRKISLIELPAPKAQKTFPNGFEHAEFVVSPPLQNLVVAYPDMNWIIKNIDKEINPDVKLQFESLSIKFHPYSLAHVVKNLEQA